MNGRFACLIVIASIFCTGFVGYLANADVEEDERQVYDYSANLVPSIISSDVQQYTPYNPTENVTGWESDVTSNAKVPTTNKVSPYILQKRVLSYSHEGYDLSEVAYKSSSDASERDFNASSADAYFTVVRADGDGTAYIYLDYKRTGGSDRMFAYLVDSVGSGSNNYGDILEGKYYIGGYSFEFEETSLDNRYRIEIIVSDKDGAILESATTLSPLYVVPASALKGSADYALLNTGDVLILNTDYRVYGIGSADDCGWTDEVKYNVYGYDWTFDMTYGAKNAVRIYDGGEDDTGLMFDKDSESWVLCKRNAQGLWYPVSNQRYTADKLVFTSIWESAVPISFEMDKVNVRPATYADNTRMVGIGVVEDSEYVTNDTAIWSNNNSNGAITFLAKLDDSTGNLHIVTKTRIGSGDTATYAVNGDWMAYTNNPSNLTPGPVTPTGYVLITLDYINGVCTYTPVTSIESRTITVNGVTVTVHNPQTYQVGGYSVRLPSVNSYPSSDINRLELTYMGGTGEAYIVDTVVQLDPEGKLWSDPAIYLGAYFPEAFDPDKAPRVWFNAFVALGNTVRINGVDYAVFEGQITVGDVKVELKGMAIDWEKAGDGLVHVYIAPGGDYDKRIDLGAVNNTPVSADLMVGGVSTPISTTEGYVISMEGVWYFEVGLYDGSSETYERLDLNITKGWGLSFSGACLLFCGCIILFTAIGTYYFKESENQPDFTDWLIIVMAIVLTIVIAGLLG